MAATTTTDSKRRQLVARRFSTSGLSQLPEAPLRYAVSVPALGLTALRSLPAHPTTDPVHHPVFRRQPNHPALR